MKDLMERWMPAVLLLSATLVLPRGGYAQYCGTPGHPGAYLNVRHGFEVVYPGGWHRLQIGPLEDEFQWVCRDTVVAQGTILDLDHVPFAGERSHADSLWKAVTHKAALFCGADGVDGGSYCEGPEEVEEVATAGGLAALKFYQTFVYEDYTTDSKETHRVGPYFALDISHEGETRALLLTPGPHRSASARYEDFVAGMVESVRAVECSCR